MMTLHEVASAVNGQLIGADVTITGVESDSRRVTAGQLFVALVGEKLDGHGFVPQVQAAGAAAALVSTPVACAIPQVQVIDTRIAMGQLAHWWRQKLGLPLIAVTGSNGKTTTKEMIAAIMQAHLADHAAVLATAGNFNNDIGMPLTLLRLQAKHRCAVIEMGMNHLGEIDYLTRLARPDVAVIINAGTAHIGELGSRENIAKAKGEIFAGLSRDGVAVINADSPFADYWRGLNVGRRIVTFGIQADADVRGVVETQGHLPGLTVHHQNQSVRVQLTVPGEHNMMNALAAVATTLAAGVSLQAIAAGLQGFAGVKGRLQIKTAANGACVIDDTYNANPDSMKAALDVLRHYANPTWLVMGDMGELGEDAPAMHAMVGEYAKQCGIQHFYALGEYSRAAVLAYGAGAQHFETVEDLMHALITTMGAQDVVLVKGSRFMQMERVVQGLMATSQV